MPDVNVVVATYKKIDLVFHTQVFKLKREMRKTLALQFPLRSSLKMR